MKVPWVLSIMWAVAATATYLMSFALAGVTTWQATGLLLCGVCIGVCVSATQWSIRSARRSLSTPPLKLFDVARRPFDHPDRSAVVSMSVDDRGSVQTTAYVGENFPADRLVTGLEDMRDLYASKLLRHPDVS